MHKPGPKEIAARQMREARFAEKHQPVKKVRAKAAKPAPRSAASAKTN